MSLLQVLYFLNEWILACLFFQLPRLSYKWQLIQAKLRMKYLYTFPDRLLQNFYAVLKAHKRLRMSPKGLNVISSLKYQKWIFDIYVFWKHLSRNMGKKPIDSRLLYSTKIAMWFKSPRKVTEVTYGL